MVILWFSYGKPICFRRMWPSPISIWTPRIWEVASPGRTRFGFSGLDGPVGRLPWCFPTGKIRKNEGNIMEIYGYKAVSMAIHRYLQILDIFHDWGVGVDTSSEVTLLSRHLGRGCWNPVRPGAIRCFGYHPLWGGHGFWRWMDSLCVWNVSQSFRLHKVTIFSEHDIFYRFNIRCSTDKNVCFHGMIPMALPRKKGVLSQQHLFFFFRCFPSTFSCPNIILFVVRHDLLIYIYIWYIYNIHLHSIFIIWTIKQ